MPRAKRVRPALDGAVKSRGREQRAGLIDRVQNLVDEYERVFVFSFENMRTTPFKVLRAEWASSRFLMGKNKVIRVALGNSEDDSFRPGSWKLGELMEGQRGLLFTNESVDHVQRYFAEFGEYDYARARTVVDETFVIEPGPLHGVLHSMAPQLESLGLPVELRKGIIHVTSPHTVCEAGKPVSAEGAQLLKIFNKPLAIFHLTVEAVWEADSGELRHFDTGRSLPIAPLDEDEAEEDAEDDELRAKEAGRARGGGRRRRGLGAKK